MRDEKRIERICNALKELWMKTPDQRFGQMMINNGLMFDGELWHIEDDGWEKHIKKQSKGGKNDN